MKVLPIKVLYIFLLAMVLNFAAAAQTDFDEPKWTKFEPEREEFTLNFPAPTASRALNRTNDLLTHGEYFVVQNKTYFAVFSDNKHDDSIMRMILDLADSGVKPKDIEIDGIKGRRYDFKGSDDYAHSFIAIRGPEHFYIFHVFGETRDNPMIEEFLGSIKLSRQIPAAVPPAETAAPAPSASSTSSGIGSARGNILKDPSLPGGSGGPGIGEGPGETAPPKYARIDSGVTIISRPKPAFTTMARRYQVSGAVRLRITFEKNGQIGPITTVIKLPLGLTQSAISAARQIRFSPAMRKGEPYAVSKIVEFSFFIY